MLKILITGGNGNIASMIKKNLKNKYDITNLSRKELDLLDYNTLESFFNNINNKFDIVVHTAVLGGRRTKIENGETTYINLIMFENLLKFADKFKMIINIDSGAIYDRNTDILNRKENDLYTIPNDYYGFSKYIIYNRSLQYDNVVNLRVFNIFHKKEENDRFIRMCFNAKNNDENITIFKDKYFDFFYETDFMKILDYYFDSIKPENNSKLIYKTLNIGYKEKYKLSEIAKLIIEDDNKIIIMEPNSNNYSGNVEKLYKLNIEFNGLEKSLQCFGDEVDSQIIMRR